MSRQHNALGQLMRTTDAHAGRTDYWFDPMGGAAALRDANGKAMLAQYNSFGHRLESRDPPRTRASGPLPTTPLADC